MALYNFDLDSFLINRRRTNHPLGGGSDSVRISASLNVAGRKYPAQFLNMGDLSDTGKTYRTGLTFTNVEVQENETVSFSFLIVNSGHQDLSKVQNLLNQGTDKLAEAGASGALSAVGGIWGYMIAGGVAILDEIVKGLISIFAANCDGIVAGDVLTLTGAQLAKQVGQQKASFNRDYAGSNSPSGCGSNSDYAVQSSIVYAGIGDGIHIGAYDGVWNPATHGQFVDFGIPAAQIAQQYKTRFDANFRLTGIQPYVQGGAVCYDMVFDPGTYSQAVIWETDEASAVKSDAQMSSKGLRMLTVRPFVHNSQLRLCLVWNDGTQSQFVSFNKTADTLQAQVSDLAQKGLHPANISASQFGTEILYSAIFKPALNAGYLMGYALSDLDKAYKDNYQKGVRLSSLTSFTIDGQPRFNAVFQTSSTAQFASWTKSQADLKTQYSDMWIKGYRLISLDGF